jgi:hypothetical protein
MPNAKLSGAVTSHINQRTRVLADRTLCYARAQFPLTAGEIEEIMIDPDILKRMKALWQDGVRTIDRQTTVQMALLRSDVPNLRRSALIAMQLPKPIFAMCENRYWGVKNGFNRTEFAQLMPNLTALTPEKVQALLAWTERVIAQMRKVEICLHVTAVMLSEKVSPTAAHLMARWPLLATLVDDMGTKWNSQLRTYQPDNRWKDLFRNTPKHMGRYRPDATFMATYSKLIKISDQVLSAGLLLAEFKWDQTTQIIPEIAHFELLDGDYRLPGRP